MPFCGRRVQLPRSLRHKRVLRIHEHSSETMRSPMVPAMELGVFLETSQMHGKTPRNVGNVVIQTDAR